MGIFKPFRWLNKQEIETVATELLLRMELIPSYAHNWPLDTTKVAEFLGLDVVWDTIPDDQIGQIAGKLLPLEHLIEINEELAQMHGAIGEATIAHEIGHWLLHINPLAVQRFLKLQARGVKLNQVQPVLHRTEGSRDRMEWEADYFASCLLMPEYILLEKRQKLDLTCPEHVGLMAQELGVRSCDLAVRLQDLGWLKSSFTQLCR